jgi:hypothetical protein
MPVQLRCVDKGHQGELWTLNLGDNVVVRNPAGEVAGEFEAAEAGDCFQLPSFSESIKYFGVLLGDKVWCFDVSKGDLKEIKTFLNRTVAAAGPEAVLAVRNRAIRDVLIGAACVVGGGVLTVGSFLAAANQPEGGQYTVTYGLILFGLIMLGKGAYGFVRYGKVKQLAQESADSQAG